MPKYQIGECVTVSNTPPLGIITKVGKRKRNKQQWYEVSQSGIYSIQFEENLRLYEPRIQTTLNFKNQY